MAQRKSSVGSAISSGGKGSVGSSSHGRHLTEDRMKLRNLIRLCMNDEYNRAQQEEEERKSRRNKVTFKKVESADNVMDEFNLGD